MNYDEQTYGMYTANRSIVGDVGEDESGDRYGLQKMDTTYALPVFECILFFHGHSVLDSWVCKSDRSAMVCSRLGSEIRSQITQDTK